MNQSLFVNNTNVAGTGTLAATALRGVVTLEFANFTGNNVGDAGGGVSVDKAPAGGGGASLIVSDRCVHGLRAASA